MIKIPVSEKMLKLKITMLCSVFLITAFCFSIAVNLFFNNKDFLLLPIMASMFLLPIIYAINKTMSRLLSEPVFENILKFSIFPILIVLSMLVKFQPVGMFSDFYSKLLMFSHEGLLRTSASIPEISYFMLHIPLLAFFKTNTVAAVKMIGLALWTIQAILLKTLTYNLIRSRNIANLAIIVSTFATMPEIIVSNTSNFIPFNILAIISLIFAYNYQNNKKYILYIVISGILCGMCFLFSFINALVLFTAQIIMVFLNGNSSKNHLSYDFKAATVFTAVGLLCWMIPVFTVKFILESFHYSNAKLYIISPELIEALKLWKNMSFFDYANGVKERIASLSSLRPKEAFWFSEGLTSLQLSLGIAEDKIYWYLSSSRFFVLLCSCIGLAVSLPRAKENYIICSTNLIASFLLMANILIPIYKPEIYGILAPFIALYAAIGLNEIMKYIWQKVCFMTKKYKDIRPKT